MVLNPNASVEPLRLQDGRMVTRQPEELSPIQSLCHRDRSMLDVRHSIQGCILYLFHDAGPGGTSANCAKIGRVPALGVSYIAASE
jgi:hypothetical protein